MGTVFEDIEDELEGVKNKIRAIEKEQALLEGKRLAWDEAKTILWSLLDKWDDKEDKA